MRSLALAFTLATLGCSASGDLEKLHHGVKSLKIENSSSHSFNFTADETKLLNSQWRFRSDLEFPVRSSAFRYLCVNLSGNTIVGDTHVLKNEKEYFLRLYAADYYGDTGSVCVGPLSSVLSKARHAEFESLVKESR